MWNLSSPARDGNQAPSLEGKVLTPGPPGKSPFSHFNGISGTGNTQAALWLETGTLVVYGVYVFVIGWWAQASVAICFTAEIIYYALLLLTSLIYLKKAKWQNKKI